MPIYLALGFYICEIIKSKIKFDITWSKNIIKNLLFIIKDKTAVILILSFTVCLGYSSFKCLPSAQQKFKQMLDYGYLIKISDFLPKLMFESRIYPNYEYGIKRIEVIKEQKLNLFSEKSINLLVPKIIHLNNNIVYNKVSNSRCCLDLFKFSLLNKNTLLYLESSGWCFDLDDKSKLEGWKLVMESSNMFYELPLKPVERPDVSKAFNRDLLTSGFGITGLFPINAKIQFPIKFYMLNKHNNKLFDLKYSLDSNNFDVER